MQIAVRSLANRYRLRKTSLLPQTENAPLSVTSEGTVAFRSGLLEQTQMTWVDRSGQSLASLDEPGPFLQIELSGDAKRIVVQRTLSGSDILPRRCRARRVLSFRQRSRRTGCRLVARRTWARVLRRSAVFRKSIDGGDQSLLIDLPNLRAPILEQWSSDGRFLVFLSAGGIWAAPLSGDRKPFQVVAPTGNLVDEPQLSPDSHWLAFNSSESGRSEIYVQPFPSGANAFGLRPAAAHSRNGEPMAKNCFFLALDGTLMSAEMKVNDSAIAPTTPRPLFQTG
jgi:hypothetical protein